MSTHPQAKPNGKAVAEINDPNRPVGVYQAFNAHHTSDDWVAKFRGAMVSQDSQVDQGASSFSGLPEEDYVQSTLELDAQGNPVPAAPEGSFIDESAVAWRLVFGLAVDATPTAVLETAMEATTLAGWLGMLMTEPEHAMLDEMLDEMLAEMLAEMLDGISWYTMPHVPIM